MHKRKTPSYGYCCEACFGCVLRLSCLLIYSQTIEKRSCLQDPVASQSNTHSILKLELQTAHPLLELLDNPLFICLPFRLESG